MFFCFISCVFSTLVTPVAVEALTSKSPYHEVHTPKRLLFIHLCHLCEDWTWILVLYRGRTVWWTRWTEERKKKHTTLFTWLSTSIFSVSHGPIKVGCMPADLLFWGSIIQTEQSWWCEIHLHSIVLALCFHFGETITYKHTYYRLIKQASLCWMILFPNLSFIAVAVVE